MSFNLPVLAFYAEQNIGSVMLGWIGGLPCRAQEQ